MSDPSAPFGDVKQSGLGREGASDGPGSELLHGTFGGGVAHLTYEAGH